MGQIIAEESTVIRARYKKKKPSAIIKRLFLLSDS